MCVQVGWIEDKTRVITTHALMHPHNQSYTLTLTHSLTHTPRKISDEHGQDGDKSQGDKECEHPAAERGRRDDGEDEPPRTRQDVTVGSGRMSAGERQV